MTGVASVAGINVCCALTAGKRAVMTTDTGTDNMTMIDRADLHRNPGCWARLMTGVTGIGGINMSR